MGEDGRQSIEHREGQSLSQLVISFLGGAKRMWAIGCLRVWLGKLLTLKAFPQSFHRPIYIQKYALSIYGICI